MKSMHKTRVNKHKKKELNALQHPAPNDLEMVENFRMFNCVVVVAEGFEPPTLCL